MSLELSFYGDDFTGSSGVMEVLSFAGLDTMLFLEPPSPEDLAQYPHLKAVGVPGVARSKTPEWMRAELPSVFEKLKALGAPLCHYKVCSTFDSAPQIGSIGVATEVGADVFDPEWIPLLVGAPELGRYQIFGTLFAVAQGAVHRLDRHPVMARHPVTPMAEADLCGHLAAQSALRSGVVDFTQMAAGRADVALRSARQGGARIVALDAMDGASLAEAGRLIAEAGGFAVGSQGVQYALVEHWRRTGALPEYSPPQAGAAPRLFGVCGSVSPITAEQIARAEAQGAAVIGFDATQAVEAQACAAEVERVAVDAQAALASTDVLVATARGPDSPEVARMAQACAAAGVPISAANDRIGQALGQITAQVQATAKLQRLAIWGGDTSGHALGVLGVKALSAVAPLAPGAPLCRLHGGPADGAEIVLKGGQMGGPDFFYRTKQGG